MRTDDFWEIVQRARHHGATEGEHLAALTCELQRIGESALRYFEAQLETELDALNTEALRDIAEQLWVMPDEAWLHFRAWCVGEGRDFFAELLGNPSRVLKRLSEERGGPFDPPSGELFLYCAEYARVARARAVA